MTFPGKKLERIKMNKLIKVQCHTNLDDYSREEWPTHLYNPKVGDFVQAKSGKILKIFSITHLYNDATMGYTSHKYQMSSPALKVELHK